MLDLLLEGALLTLVAVRPPEKGFLSPDTSYYQFRVTSSLDATWIFSCVCYVYICLNSCFRLGVLHSATVRDIQMSIATDDIVEM